MAYRYHERVFLKHNKLLAADRQDEEDLVAQRVEAGVEELNFDHWHLRESLTRSHIALDNRIMSQLAIWEPRTFRYVNSCRSATENNAIAQRLKNKKVGV